MIPKTRRGVESKARFMTGKGHAKHENIQLNIFKLDGQAEGGFLWC